MASHTSLLMRCTNEFLEVTGTLRDLHALEDHSSLPHPQAGAPDHHLPSLLTNEAERKRKLYEQAVRNLSHKLVTSSFKAKTAHEINCTVQLATQTKGYRKLN